MYRSLKNARFQHNALVSCLFDDDKPKEECGVIGLHTPGRDAGRLAFFGLFALQHRGQESAGIAISDGSQVEMRKGMGLVSQVFNEELLGEMPGSMALGHTRYSTTGASVIHNAQPYYCLSRVGEIAVAHNGNLTNTITLRRELEAEGLKFESTSDTELMAKLIAREIRKDPADAVRHAMERIEGAYSAIILTPETIIAFRDPHAIRPLVAGRLGNGHMVASESCAFSIIGGEIERELGPGEMVIIDKKGMRFEQAVTAGRCAHCLFEFIYFARPDSRMSDNTVYTVRERMGAALYGEHPVDADIVIPVPDSGVPAAHGYAAAANLPFVEGMIKNRYVQRTFIQPDPRLREVGVMMKLSPIYDHLRGKRVVLVDDSIVRSTTCRQIVRLLKNAGAKELHVRITAPPIKHPCFYGIDMSTPGQLVAANHTIEEIRDMVGADSLGFLSIEGTVKATGLPADKLCLACFNGDYVLPVEQGVDKDALEGHGRVGEMETYQTN